MFFSVPFCWDLGKQNSLKPYHSLPFLKKTKTNPESTNIYLRHWFGTHGNDWNALSPWLIVLPPAHGAPKELIWKKKKRKAFNTKQAFHVHKPSVLWLQPAESWCCHSSPPCPGGQYVLSRIQTQPQFGWFQWEGHCYESLLSISSARCKHKSGADKHSQGSVEPIASVFLSLLSSKADFTGTFSTTCQGPR